MAQPLPDTFSSLRTRASLLLRLRDWKDTVSWDEFYQIYHKMIFGYARRNGLTREEAEEVTQDVFLRVSQTIHDFEKQPRPGTFRAWLMNLTRWRVGDKFRQRKGAQPVRQQARDDDGTATIERLPDPAVPDPDEYWEQEWRGQVLKAAFARLARRVKNTKHFQAFELHTRQHWSVLQVSREMGINPAAVYLITHRLTRQLRQEVEKLQQTLG